jgi:hypothetical protein
MEPWAAIERRRRIWRAPTPELGRREAFETPARMEKLVRHSGGALGSCESLVRIESPGRRLMYRLADRLYTDTLSNTSRHHPRDLVARNASQENPVMSHDPRPLSSLFSQVDVSSSGSVQSTPGRSLGADAEALLRDVLSAQDRTNELLEELVTIMGAAQKQRMSELNQWKQTNPRLAKNCRQAAEALSRVQVEYLETITDEINSNSDAMMEGEFMLNEFVDRFGPRLAHINGVIQVLAQLSSAASPAPAQGNS